MNIGVIGSGIVGQTLAKGLIKHGYDVMIGTNHPGKYEELKRAIGGKVKVGTFEDVGKFGEILVLAVKGTAAEAAVKSAGITHLNGKTVIDATNPIADAPPVNGVLKFFTSLDESLMERLQRQAPAAHFVKAFSCVGNALMVNPSLGAVKPTMFMCGNDAEAKQQARRIVEQFGFEVEDMGGAEAARAIEPLCILWCIPGFLRNEWMHAFKLLKKT
jgi:predicted dinucleotide-binding enzyme